VAECCVTRLQAINAKNKVVIAPKIRIIFIFLPFSIVRTFYSGANFHLYRNPA
jgi:hypothetical protein